MRVLPDTSVLIAYLLTPRPHSPATITVTGALAGEFVTLAPREMLDELHRTIAKSDYLAPRIPSAAVERLTRALLAIAELPTPIIGPLPPICRDPKDNYLIAHALAGHADYLVSYDDDLLVLGQVAW